MKIWRRILVFFSHIITASQPTINSHTTKTHILHIVPLPEVVRHLHVMPRTLPRQLGQQVSITACNCEVTFTSHFISEPDQSKTNTVIDMTLIRRMNSPGILKHHLCHYTIQKSRWAEWFSCDLFLFYQSNIHKRFLCSTLTWDSSSNLNSKLPQSERQHYIKIIELCRQLRKLQEICRQLNILDISYLYKNLPFIEVRKYFWERIATVHLFLHRVYSR